MSVTASPFRLLRTGTIGATVLSLAAGAHVMGGGVLPAPAIMVALIALNVLASTVVTKFRLSLPAMVGLVAVSQLVLHQAFDSLSVGIRTDLLPAGATSSLHDHSMSAMAQSAAVLQATMGDAGTAGMVHSSGSSVWMLAAHGAATLGIAVVLARGEHALWSLASWLRPLFVRAAPMPVIPARPSRPALAPVLLPALPWRNLRFDSRRGPPHTALFFA
jgi:hypothetical protein